MKSARKDIANLVHDDIEQRVAMGAKQYGERLTSFNGRDALQDAYEEAVDLALYLRQAIAERRELEDCRKRILHTNDPA